MLSSVIASPTNQQPIPPAQLDLTPTATNVTCQPYTGKDTFGKAFRKVRKWADIERPLTFHELRTTALTNLGNKGATMAGIITLGVWKLGRYFGCGRHQVKLSWRDGVVGLWERL